jgi:hypothetical protein
MLLGLKDGPLCAPKSDNSSGEPRSFAKVPDGQQTVTLVAKINKLTVAKV